MTDKENYSHPDQQARINMLNSYSVETVHGLQQDVYFNSYPEEIKLEEELEFATLVNKVINWHQDRNLIDGSSDKDQALKLLQELGELSDSICKGGDIKDDIGDMLVVMLNITTRNKVSLSQCLAKAWEDIKDRKGKMIDGIFVKEEDLNNKN
tara:strand:+ start:316 stop:774 length:459 start_codon:yes stop_codon:yes gene_type:complete